MQFNIRPQYGIRKKPRKNIILSITLKTHTHTHTHTRARARTRSLSLFFLFQRSFAATVATIIVVSIILRNALRMSRIIREDIRIHCTFASTKHQTFRGLSGGKYDNKLIV